MTHEAAEQLTAWATVGNAVAALVAALAASIGLGIAWWQLRGIKDGLKVSSLMAVLEIETQMNERKVHFDECSANVRLGKTEGASKDSMIIRADLFNTAKENYFNALDRLCYCILHGYLQDKDWRAEYRNTIHNVIHNFPDDFNEASPFRNIKELNRKWQAE